jgi:multidrug efflux pump subunit AcrA (membrane-fusion protein)
MPKPLDTPSLVSEEDNQLPRGNTQITRALQESEAAKREAEAARHAAMAKQQEELDNRQAALLAQQQEQEQQQQQDQRRRKRRQQQSISSTPHFWGSGNTYDVVRLSKTNDADLLNALQKCCSTDKLSHLGVGRDVHDTHLAGGK